MRSFGVLTAVLAFGLLAGCSKPTETVIPSDPAAWEKELAPVMKKLSDEDRQRVAAYLVRAKMGEVFGVGGMPIGTTVGDAITQQREWETQQAVKAEQEAKRAAEAKALKEQLEKERAERAAAVAEAVTVTLISKGRQEKNYNVGRYSDRQTLTIGVKNNALKTMKGVSGEMFFVDLFGKDVGSVTFKVTEDIEPGGTHIWEGARDYNQFMSEHRAVWELEEGKYSTRFEPETVLYEDGSKLSLTKE